MPEKEIEDASVQRSLGDVGTTEKGYEPRSFLLSYLSIWRLWLTEIGATVCPVEKRI